MSEAYTPSGSRHPAKLIEESAELRDEQPGMLLILRITEVSRKSHKHRPTATHTYERTLNPLMKRSPK